MGETVLTCLRKGTRFLESAGVPEAKISAEHLLSHVLNQPPLSLYWDPKAEINAQYESEFENLLTKRASRYPLQYLLQTVPFRNTVLEVGAGCLIPRPETEVLVEVVLRTLGETPLQILDVGTGSGNIAISLAQERMDWNMTATDSSSEALRYAKINAARNGVSQQIHFVQTDLWNGIENSFDAIVSNPPYLTERELNELEPEIGFEPREALDGGRDGLYFFRQIIQNAKSVLKPEGFIFFELGLGQAQAASNLFEANSFGSIEISRDDSGVERFISACL